jgi:two-component system sensor kinase FixL
MLRASLPLFAPDGERRGILTLSYLGTQLLGRLGAIAGAGPSELWLLNGEGYWLVGPDPDLEWAFMSPDRSDRAMAVRYPGAWARLATEVTGTFAMEAGLLTFRRVYPLTADLPTAHARGLAIPATPQRYFWIVATLLPGEVLAGRSGTLFRDLALGYSMLALLTLVAALGVSYLSARGRALVQVMTRVVDNVPDLISYIDASQHYRFTNRAYHRLFGLSPEAIYGRTVRDLLGDAAYAAIRPHLERALRGERVSFETRVHYSGPGLREVSVTYVPDLGAGGEVRGLFVVVNDITRLKDAERRERERTLEVAHSARLASVGEMATQIAHEVNQPLTAIVTYCAAALRSVQGGAPDPSRLREWVSAISDEAQRVSEIVRRLRQFVRRGEMVRAPLDLGEVVGEVVSMVQPEASHKGVTLVVDGAPALPAVLADRILIAQAILNLLRNALDAVAGEPPDRRRVTVSTTIDGDRVEVTVADSGPGVGPGVGGQLFESFVTTKPDGLGMGLSITRSIVEAHGGQVRHAPAPGGGAMFSFSLPRTQG